MKVNLRKSKMMVHVHVLRNCGMLKQNEKLFYAGSQMEIVLQYKYLRIVFKFSKMEFST